MFTDCFSPISISMEWYLLCFIFVILFAIAGIIIIPPNAIHFFFFIIRTGHLLIVNLRQKMSILLANELASNWLIAE